MLTRTKFVYLPPATEDFEKIVKHHIASASVASERA